MGSLECFIEAKAPVNIAVIKYWGKLNETLKIPLNDSLSGTLSIDDLCTKTSVQLSANFQRDTLILNDDEQELSERSPATIMLKDIRSISPLAEGQILKSKARIVSSNNFPTAAGLASSASGYACLAYALGHAYGVTDLTLLSKIARKGSGSACRSLFGGFVHWVRGVDHDTSLATQVADEHHWPEMRVVICVVNESKKDVSSSLGMGRSARTSPLLRLRADYVVPKRIADITKAIRDRDFEEFSNITMQDSNEFHAICLDTFPPVFYLNETSRRIISLCHLINSFYGRNMVAYTFDAGPNACIYLLEHFVSTFLAIIRFFFSEEETGKTLEIKGRPFAPAEQVAIDPILDHLKESGFLRIFDSLKYLINTSIGSGPKLIEKR